MPDLWMDVDAALASVPVNIVPLIDDTDFKTREESVTYDQAGMDLVWNFTTTAGTTTQTAVTPTTGGDYDWTNLGNGMYAIEITASGGASINNDTEGVGWFSGFATGVLPWRGPTIGFRAAGLNNLLIDSAYSATRGLAGTAVPDAVADAAGGLAISDLGGLDLDAILADTNELQADWTNTGRLDTILDSILTDTGEIGAAGAGLTAVPWNAAWDAEVQSEATDALNAYDPPTKAELDSGLAALNDPTAAAIADAVWDEAKAGHVAAGSFGEEVQAHALSSEVSAVETDTQDIQSRLPAALVGGAMDSDVSAMQAGVVTAAAVATDAVDADAVAADAAVEIAAAVWDRVLSGATHNIASSAGRRLRTLQEFQGYANGAVWIDTVNGTAGTTDFENGTVENPVDSIADANTIAASIGLSRFELAPGSSITFAATQSNQVFSGHGWTLALGGQSIVGTTIIGATVSGIASGTGTTQIFEKCLMNAVSHIKGTHVLESGIAGTQTLVEAGDFFCDRCHSGVAGTGTPTLDVGGAIGNSNVNFRNYSGGIQLESFGDAGTDTMSLEGNGQFVEGTCTGGTVAVRGNFTVSGISNLTLSDDARIDVAQINAECDTALSDYDAPTKAELDSGLAALNDPTAAAVADQVWDEAKAGHTAGGSFGEEVQAHALSSEVSGLNDLSAAQVNAECDTALSDYDAPTNAEMEARTLVTASYATAAALATVDGIVDAILVDTDTTIPALIAALNDLSAAAVNAEVVDVIRTDTATELAAVPAASPALHTMMQLVYMTLRNKIDVTASAKEIHDDAGGVLATKTLSDDGTTYSESKAA